MALAAATTSALSLSHVFGRTRRPVLSHPQPPGISPPTQAFFNRLFTPPEATRALLYGNLIDALVSVGVWDLLDCLYVFAAADHVSALTNLVADSPRAIWPAQIGFFTSEQGVTPLGTDNSLDTGFIPSRAAHFAQNSASLFAWNLSTTPQPGYMLGSTENHISPYDNFDSNHTLWAINSAAELDAGLVAPDASGFWLTNRTSPTFSELRRNDVQLATSSAASVRPGNSNIFAVSNNTCQLAVVGTGAGLTSDQSSALYTALQQYLQAIGTI